ncbi:MAG TPA: TonB-dependent receptor [Chryseobacterium sp.]|nr:TonB-dependent receptor [Chryseobacterium sp.]
MKKIIVPCFLLCTVLSVFGQTRESDVEEVTVTGKFLHLPVRQVNENITVVTREEIQSSPAQSIEELLSEFTGFDIQRRGGNGVQADITLRGSSFEQVLILVNGVRMNDSQTGHNSMSLPFDLSAVERVEIIKGPAARRFGQNAYAGVINVITRPSSSNEVQISGSGGDFESWSLAGQARVGTDSFSHLIQASGSASQGYRYNTDYIIHNVFYQNQLRTDTGTLSFQAGMQEKKFGANGFYSSPKASEQYEETQASIVNVGWRQPFGKADFNAQVNWRRGQDMYLFNRAKPEIYRNMHIGNNIGAEANISLPWKLGTTGFGTELRKEFLASNNLGHRERFLTQLFAEHHFSFLNDRLQVSPGISWANYDEAGSFFYPGMDVGFTFKNHHKIYGNIAKVHRIPTFTDLYYVSKTEKGNPDLQPENALSAELGYRFQLSAFTLKASVFARDTENAIDWLKEKEEEIWRADNIGDLRTRGAEAEAGWSGSGFIKNFTVGYTFLDSKVKQPPVGYSRYILENLKHQLNSRLETRWTRNLTSQLVYKYNERVTTGSYHLLDAKINLNLARLNVYALANNITNTAYTETFAVPMPGRWFHLGFTYKINLHQN